MNANVTASCIDLNTILFAKDNIIYRCDVSLATPLTPTVEINTIPLGSKILCLYVNNNILTIVTKAMSDTVIYMANLNTATNKYALYQNEKIVGVTCLGAVGDRNSIYWVSATTIYQFNGGQSQEMTKF